MASFSSGLSVLLKDCSKSYCCEFICVTKLFLPNSVSCLNIDSFPICWSIVSEDSEPLFFAANVESDVVTLVLAATGDWKFSNSGLNVYCF